MPVRYGSRHMEITRDCKISKMGSEGHLSVITETWNIPPGNLVAGDTFESDVLVIPGGSRVFQVLVTTAFGAILTFQLRNRESKGTSRGLFRGSWDSVILEAALADLRVGDRVMGINHQVTRMLNNLLDARQMDVQVRLRQSANLIISTQTEEVYKMAIIYINI